MHNFEEENTVETIDGGGGSNNILAGTKEQDTLDLTETTLERIQHIELEGENDILRLGSDSLKNVKDITIDGGGGDDSIEGTEQADKLDFSGMTIKNLETH